MMAALLKCFRKKRTSEEGLKEKHKSQKNCEKMSYENGSFSNTVDGDSTNVIAKPGRLKEKKAKHSSCCGGDKVSTSGTDTLPLENGNFYQDSNEPGLAVMPVSQNNPFYNMNHPFRGKAVIFNFDRWANTEIPDLELTPRKGSEKDRDDLGKCFRALDFFVQVHNNLTGREFLNELALLRDEDHSRCDCLVIVIMSHGEKNTVYFKDGMQMPVNLIWEDFEAHHCPTLAGKPKIFIIQACRGKKYDTGTTLMAAKNYPRASSNQDTTDSGTFSYVIPNAADIFVAFSCPLGHYSWRSPEKGSWFIQAICKVFAEHGLTLELQELFTHVAREVALHYSSRTDDIESNNKRQVPSTSSTLIRSVFFKPKPPMQPFRENFVVEVSDSIDSDAIHEERGEITVSNESTSTHALETSVDANNVHSITSV